MTARLLTPTKITAWLDCAHYLTLRRRVDAGMLIVESRGFGEMAQMLQQKGLEHEEDCLAWYENEGRSMYRVPDRYERENFTQWVNRIGNPLDGEHDVVFQMPMIHDGIRGVADFLLRTVHPETGRVTYEPLDAKLARNEAKPGHVLQLCFYADAIEALTGEQPEYLHIWLGSGRVERIRYVEVAPYWRRLRHQLAAVLDDTTHAETAPEPCAHCEFCEFEGVCEEQWRAEDSLVYVAGIRRSDREVLTADGADTLAALSELDTEVEIGIEDVEPARLDTLVRQASLQVSAREHPEARPPFELVDEQRASEAPVGLADLPEPDDGDVFLDFEGHPFWTASEGLFFLLGLIQRDDSDPWTFHEYWAHDKPGEAAATEALVGDFVERRREHPGMHIYHYNHTERSALQALTTEHGVAEADLDTLINEGVFVDLLPIIRNAVQIGVESYGLKHVEQVTGYERSHEIDRGAGAVVEYERYMRGEEGADLTRIARYNEDDVRATRAVRDWLVAQRSADMEWPHNPEFDDEDEPAELDQRIARLYEFEPGTTEHLTGDLLGYWRREWRVHAADMMMRLARSSDEQIEDESMIARLHSEGLVERLGKRGKPITPALEFSYPPQPLGRDLREPNDRATVVFLAGTESIGFASVVENDPESGRIQLMWNEEMQESGVVPTSIVHNGWVGPRPKPDALAALADHLLGQESADPTSEVGLSLLRRDLPAFVEGHGPNDGIFTGDLDEILAWTPYLDDSYVAVQGPPGTGKTYNGAQMARRLILDGKRVGVTAMSHAAIENLLAEIVAVFTESGDLDRLRAIQKVPDSRDPMPPIVAGSNKECADPEFNLVAGTTWLFAGKDMRHSPVDVLIVDEAGQLGLPDALAASTSARNLILLGDPQQLPQVSQATHPGGAGNSVLEHVLGGESTIASSRGVFLPVTRRMHPDVCRFISEQIYEGRLGSDPGCAVQSSVAGTGLRWLRAEHEDCSTESPVEADIVAAQIAELIGTDWTDREGVTRPLGVGDFMVVAPYNDQVNLLRAKLDANSVTSGVRVGTVDKFQGQEAPVVFFSMTTSSGDDMPRGPEFLFSRNRLNVAISRARILAYLVCTDELLNSRAKDIEAMRLISTLCAFVEYAD